MMNKLWYQALHHSKEAEELQWVENYLQELIDLYFFDSDKFKIPSDITYDNLPQFLEIILKQYQLYHIRPSLLADLADALEAYFYVVYFDIVEGCPMHPEYSENDNRYAALIVFDKCLQGAGEWSLFFPEEVPLVLEYLNAPKAQLVNLKEKLDAYFKQFDFMKRCNIELPLRNIVLRRQRIEALEKKGLIPIKPMGLELDMCYKKDTLTSRRGKLWESIFGSYWSLLSDKYPEVYEKFLFGTESDAEDILKNYEEIHINRCRECGSLKSNLGDSICSNCNLLSKPLLSRG